jgi:hypothetical protein
MQNSTLGKLLAALTVLIVVLGTALHFLIPAGRKTRLLPFRSRLRTISNRHNLSFMLP